MLSFSAVGYSYFGARMKEKKKRDMKEMCSSSCVCNFCHAIQFKQKQKPATGMSDRKP